MTCDEKLRLSLAYDHASKMLSMTAADLNAAVHGSPEDFQAKRQRYVLAVTNLRELRHALWKHRQEHHC
jgi:hypothetical protein